MEVPPGLCKGRNGCSCAAVSSFWGCQSVSARDAMGALMLPCLRTRRNVDDSLSHANAGHEQLLRYWKGVSSNRALIAKVFAVLFFFVVMFATFMG